jgi:hypothetical protein
MQSSWSYDLAEKTFHFIQYLQDTREILKAYICVKKKALAKLMAHEYIYVCMFISKPKSNQHLTRVIEHPHSRLHPRLERRFGSHQKATRREDGVGRREEEGPR